MKHKTQTAALLIVLSIAGLLGVAPSSSKQLVAATSHATGSLNFADNELVTVSGIRAVLLHTPDPSGSLVLVVDGAVFCQGSSADYLLSGATITFARAPRSGANVRAWYRY